MIRVVHLLPDLAVAGGPRYVLNLLTSSPRGSKITHYVAAVVDGPMHRSFDEAGVSTHVLAGDRASRFRKPAMSLGELIDRVGIDVIHINGTPDERIIGQLAARGRQVVVVNTFHGVALGDLVPHDRRHALERAKRHARTLVSRRLVRIGNQQVVAVSELVMDSHARALGLPRDQIVVIPPGLPAALLAPREADTRRAVRSELGVADGETLVMNVARFDPAKGQGDLVEAFAMLGERPDLRLALVGDGPTRPAVEAQIHSHGRGVEVMFLGAREDVPRLLQGADVFVNASTNDGFGIAPLEAMASGLPVVALTGLNNAIDEFIDDGSTGVLVVEGDPAQLAFAIEGLLDDESTRKRLGAAAQQAARAWSAAESIRRLEELYARLADDDRVEAPANHDPS